MSITDFVKDVDRVAALKRGVATMKARKPSDSTSWFYQAAVHGVTEEAVTEAAVQDLDVNNVEQEKFWRQCPHSGAPSADFLLWHRAYVFYFERILRDASGDPTLSLPYWNYTGDERAFPALYGDPEEDEEQQPTNPLYEARRELLYVFGLYELADSVVTTDRIFAEERFFGPVESEGLAGGVGDSDPSTRGLIERQPHDLMHVAVGGVIGNETGLMSFVPTAAFDPVFWVHHTNIDRLWSQWETLPDRRWGSVPSLEWFHSQPWFFHDSDGSVKNLARYHYLKYRELGITYDDDDLKEPRLSDELPDGVGAPFLRLAGAGIMAEMRGATKLSATKAVSLRLLDADSANVTAEGIRALMADAPPRKTQVVVELTYSVPRSIPNVSYHVFLVPKAAETTDLKSGSPQHIGTLNLFGTHHHHGSENHVGSGVLTQTFDVTNLVREQEDFDPSQVTVVVQPFDLFKSTRKGVPMVRRAGRIVVNDVKIRVK